MARRFSRIIAATRYYSAVDNYIKYITDSTKRGTRVGQGGARPASKALFIDPFGVALGTGQVVKQTAALPSWNTFKADFALRTDDVVPSNEALIIPLGKGYKAPRVNVVSGRSGTKTVKTSAITGLKYLSYGGISTSVPFGRKDAADTIQAAFDDIKASIVSRFPTYLCSLQTEKL